MHKKTRRHDFILFDDVDTRKYQVGIYGDKLASAPERDQSFVSIPGKNGDLIIDNGRYNNITVSYQAYIISNYNSNIRGLRNALMSKTGYCKLQDSVNPDEYRMAKAIPFEVDEYGVLKAGTFTMQFICKPQRYLTEGDIPIVITSGTTIYNWRDQTALPLIRAYGTGSFSINGKSIQITRASTYTDIDCELQEAFKDSLAVNCNGNIVLTDGVFPSLTPGENTITLSGITRLDITPRWWIL